MRDLMISTTGTSIKNLISSLSKGLEGEIKRESYFEEFFEEPLFHLGVLGFLEDK